MGQKLSSQLLKVGDKAPFWAAQSIEGQVDSADYLGRKAVLLLFYPADWSDVCRNELPEMEELVTLAGNVRLKTFGISADSVSSHKAFARDIGLQLITLVSDPQHKISEDYGVIDSDEATCRRAAFLIDTEGIIRWVRVEPNKTMPRPLEEVERAVEMVREWDGLSSGLASWQRERQEAVQMPRPAPLATPTKLQLAFWGTRGSIPVSGTNYTRYGGNTSCVSLTSDTGHLFIFDCGSGARELGNYLLSEQWRPAFEDKHERNGKSYSPAKNINGYIFLSHTHWDHIQGFPFFSPVFEPGNRFNIIGWSNCSQTLGSILAGQMEYIYFPVSMDDLPSKLEFYSIRHGEARLDQAKVTGRQLKHPTPSTAYRVELAGKVLVYATDHEPIKLPPLEANTLLADELLDTELIHWARGADILIHDAQYSAAELVEKAGWGHSSIEVAVDTAIKAEVKTLILFHHDPSHDDAQIDALLSTARERAVLLGNGKLEVQAAFDGMKLDL